MYSYESLWHSWSCTECPQRHLVHAKMSLVFDPVPKRPWKHFVCIVHIKPALLQDLNPDPSTYPHVPRPARLRR